MCVIRGYRVSGLSLDSHGRYRKPKDRNIADFCCETNTDSDGDGDMIVTEKIRSMEALLSETESHVDREDITKSIHGYCKWTAFATKINKDNKAGTALTITLYHSIDSIRQWHAVSPWL